MVKRLDCGSIFYWLKEKLVSAPFLSLLSPNNPLGRSYVPPNFPGKFSEICF